MRMTWVMFVYYCLTAISNHNKICQKAKFSGHNQWCQEQRHGLPRSQTNQLSTPNLCCRGSMSTLSVKTNQLHMQDVPDNVLLLPTPISPEEQQTDILYIDANRTEEHHDQSIGEYHITLGRGRPKKLGADYAEYTSQGKGLLSIAKLSLDGQISMSLDLKRYLPDFLPSQFLTQDVDEFAVDHERWKDCPRMNIVIMIVGSRGMYTQ